MSPFEHRPGAARAIEPPVDRSQPITQVIPGSTTTDLTDDKMNQIITAINNAAWKHFTLSFVGDANALKTVVNNLILSGATQPTITATVKDTLLGMIKGYDRVSGTYVSTAKLSNMPPVMQAISALSSTQAVTTPDTTRIIEAVGDEQRMFDRGADAPLSQASGAQFNRSLMVFDSVENLSHTDCNGLTQVAVQPIQLRKFHLKPGFHHIRVAFTVRYYGTLYNHAIGLIAPYDQDTEGTPRAIRPIDVNSIFPWKGDAIAGPGFDGNTSTVGNQVMVYMDFYTTCQDWDNMALFLVTSFSGVSEEYPMHVMIMEMVP